MLLFLISALLAKCW